MKRFRVMVPAVGSSGRAQPVWRLGSVLKFCLGLSRVERSRIWRLGGATINGTPASAPHLHCRPGDVVEAWYPEQASSVAPEATLAGQLRVLYEDEWLLAIDKPAGMLSHPARSEQHGTAANAVAARYAPTTAGDIPPIRPIHRLDRDTSGVLLFAREARVAGSLARQRTAGTLARDYLALVSGRPDAQGEVTLPLAPDPTHRTRQLVTPDGKSARTTYRVIQYGGGGTLIAARLHTGRTHQLRAHMAALGHPLLGDDLYGGPVAPLARQALHAWRLRLRHPITGAALTITASLPADLREAARAALL